MAQRELPDLIVLDLIMPEMSGFDVVEALKNDSRTARIPVVIMTSKQLTAADRQLLNGYVMAIVQKTDFDPTRFIKEVRRAMSLRPNELQTGEG